MYKEYKLPQKFLYKNFNKIFYKKRNVDLIFYKNLFFFNFYKNNISSKFVKKNIINFVKFFSFIYSIQKFVKIFLLVDE